jgi:hypothetical protein
LALLIAIPVAVTQPNSCLRSTFSGQDVSSQSYVAAGSWQEQRLMAQYAGHLESTKGPSNTRFVETYPAAPQYVKIEAAPQQKRALTRSLRDLSSSRSVSYDPSAAANFTRNHNFGGVTVRANVLHSRDMLDWQENTTGKTMHKSEIDFRSKSSHKCDSAVRTASLE